MKEYSNLTSLPANPILILAGLLYAFLFLAGLFNLGIIIFRKLKGKSASLLSQQPLKKFPLEKKDSAVLISLIFLWFLFVSAFPEIVSPFIKMRPAHLILGATLLLQAGSMFIIFKYINFSFFDFSIKKKEFNLVLFIYTAAMPIVFISLVLSIFFFEFLGVEHISSPIEKITSLIDTRFALFLFGAQAVLLAPLAEELFFRGILYNLLRKKYSFFFSAISISIFFSLIHRTPLGILALFVISFAICYVYEKTQKISAAFLLHLIHNLITFLFFLGSR